MGFNKLVIYKQNHLATYMDMHDLDDQDAFNVINITRARMGNVYIILCGWTDMITECLIH